MISIVILFSVDREEQMNNTIACLEDMSLYSECEKIFVVDGKTNLDFPNFKKIEVERKGKFYCWADTLNAGVNASSHETVLYLDSDRILPINYLEKLTSIEDDDFYFPRMLFSLSKHCNANELREIRDNIKKFNKILIPDHRVLDHKKCFGRKNPFSGCVAFKKKSYLNAGGFDPSYVGWGYPDTDFFFHTTKLGYKFKSIDCSELHQKHDYKISDEKWVLMNYWNCLRCKNKWGVPIGRFIPKLLSYFSIDELLNIKTMDELMEKYKKRKVKIL